MNAIISYPFDTRLLDLFNPEEKDINRASYTIAHDEQTITFTVTANDAVAMRTVLNEITKILTVWEQTGDL